MPVTARLLAPLLLVSVAHAAGTKVAIAPLAPDAAGVEKALIEAVQQSPSLSLANLDKGKLSPPKPGVRVLQADASRLGDGRVVYLQALDAPGGKPLGSTTATIKGESGEVAAEDRAILRAAVVRVLDPGKELGRLSLKVDVQGAEVQVDGKKPLQLSGPIELPVGTHALRVTHPAYRDFLRFVDIEFDKTISIDVALSAYPLAEGEMTEKLRKQHAEKKKLPWWRTWWALSLAGVVLTGATVGIVLGARPSISVDKTVTYTAPPAP